MGRLNRQYGVWDVYVEGGLSPVGAIRVFLAQDVMRSGATARVRLSAL